MPTAPRRPCPGCGELTGGTHCERCSRRRDDDRRQHARRYDEQRGSAAARGYDHGWRKYAAGYLARHPWCVEHLKRGQHVPATRVDHVVPHRGDRALFWDAANHQALCESDHNSKTARQDGGFGNERVSL